MRSNLWHVLSSSIAVALACAGSAASAADADLSRYAKSSANLSAVAAAVSLVEPCEGNITFQEAVIESYQVVELTVTCDSDTDDSRTVILRFDMLEGGGLKPASFGAAG